MKLPYSACWGDIAFHHAPLPPYDTSYWETLHAWVASVLGPACTSWSAAKLAEMEHAAGGIIERVYPHSNTQIKLLYAQLTAVVIVIDDSIDDADIHSQLACFSRQLYRGEVQDKGLLKIYRGLLFELAEFFANDGVLYGMATTPWVNFLDACLTEKAIVDAEKRAPKGVLSMEDISVKFAHYLRSKSGIGEAYTAGVFKICRTQYLPLAKFVKVVPDLNFYIEAINDVLSFHKEQLAGETHNLIHVRTRAIAASTPANRPSWTYEDTFHLVCDEIRAATKRIDALVRLAEYGRISKSVLAL